MANHGNQQHDDQASSRSVYFKDAHGSLLLAADIRQGGTDSEDLLNYRGRVNSTKVRFDFFFELSSKRASERIS